MGTIRKLKSQFFEIGKRTKSKWTLKNRYNIYFLSFTVLRQNWHNYVKTCTPLNIIDLGKYYIKEGFKFYVADLTELTDNPEVVVEMDKMWIVNQLEGEYNPAHLHINCSISSVMYLKIPKYKPRGIPGKKNMDGKIELIYQSSGHTTQTFNQGTLSIQPQVGDIFMWPSDLIHVVYPFLGKGVRRSVSYNLGHTFSNKSGIPAPAEKSALKLISIKEARLQTKIGLLEDELKKVKSKE